MFLRYSSSAGPGPNWWWAYCAEARETLRRRAEKCMLKLFFWFFFADAFVFIFLLVFMYTATGRCWLSSVVGCRLSRLSEVKVR